MKSSRARKQLLFMADEHLQAAVEVQAAARGVSVSAFLTATVSATVLRGLREEVMLELTPSVKLELRKGFQSAAKELRPFLLRTAFEASLTRLVLLELHNKTNHDLPVKELMDRAVPQAKTRLKDLFYGLGEFEELNDQAVEFRPKKPR